MYNVFNDFVSFISSFQSKIKLYILALLDILIILLTSISSQILLFGSVQIHWLWMLFGCVSIFPVLKYLGVYRGIASETDFTTTFYKIIIGSVVANIILVLGAQSGITLVFLSTPLSCILLNFYRGLARISSNSSNEEQKKIAVYGAGAAGVILSSALAKSARYKICCFIDDNELLVGRATQQIPIISIKELQLYITKHEVTEVALAIPSLNQERKSEIIKELSAYSITITTVPPLEDIVLGKKPVESLSAFTIDDLLGRKSVVPDYNLLGKAVNEEVILVTGAGGSIGKELCFQLASLEVSKIVLLEISEHALYETERILLAGLVNCEIVIQIGSVCDENILEHIHHEHKITVIFHAAAYKHVPMMEKNVVQAVKNNIFGTYSLIQFAEKFSIKRFILISTDKAVRPTNVMGATKRFCELLLQARDKLNGADGGTIYSMVRFGNVLGSSGSVVPLFREQIKTGGPVTLTNIEVTRYFMSISEAAELVIQSSSMATGGDVFVLDMGSPIKIFDLAKAMIKLSGFSIKDDENPLGDIEIKITGLRPGEKLYEELLIGDNVTSTAHKKIMRAKESFTDWSTLNIITDNLSKAVENNDVDEILKLFATHVGGFVHDSNKL
ncbi:MAG: polysaccharide biosynthesis protein [Pseudohongiellaceae bacterium]